MNVVITSAMRNAAAHVPRYFEQVRGLRALLQARGDLLWALIGEGDSTDDTRALLNSYADSCYDRMIDVTHGGPAFGSVIDPTRFRQMAGVYNKLWAFIPAAADAVIFVEGDLIWQPQTLATLIDALADYPAVAPMTMHQLGYGEGGSRLFYDTWGYRRNGIWFGNEPPYHADLTTVPSERRCAFELDSAGSCLAMRADLAAAARFPAADMIVGFCRELRKAGGSIWLLPWLIVEHPS